MDLLQSWKMSPAQLNALFAEWLTTPPLVHLPAAEQALIVEQWAATDHHHIAVCILEALAPRARRVVLEAVNQDRTAQVEALLVAHAPLLRVAIAQQTLQFVRLHSPRCPTQSPVLMQVGALADCSVV
jgi:hypothetical protein